MDPGCAYDESHQVSAANVLGVKSSFRRHGLSEVDCQTEALFMFIAGSETTASVMRITLFYLIATPAVYQKLKAEMKAAIESGRVSSPITAAEAKQLPYLQVCISSLPMSCLNLIL
jgi:cytochrome P450